ncbi:hypothetical protein CC78DRAFT_576293 [Lojkania enalia]|uniref:Uncharacterized protein n=1 Tax=Lojkania enalia TaxID=147567 RepID=A0A9P4KJA4_9PLEO|nr:hypothetical protein CC78DRAFT_576293 [Didymosphaeria enalia]
MEFMAMSSTVPIQCPETYCFPRTRHVSNSRLPILVYRAVTPQADLTAASARQALERNRWVQGGAFKMVQAHHFHALTHECYAVFSGQKLYQYLGLYPQDSSHWGNNFCHASPQETSKKAAVARSVPIPEYDPIYREDGPLVDIRRKATVEG